MSHAEGSAPTTPFTATGAGERQAMYAALAGSAPVHRITMPAGVPGWLVTGYEEVRTALKDPRLVKGPLRSGPLGMMAPPEVNAAMTHDLLHADPPDHTRLRKLVSAAFTHRRVQALAPQIERIADDLLEGLAGQERVELIESYAYPLPITVICELLGVPEEGRSEFRDWSSTITSGSLAGQERFAEAAVAMIAYVRQLLDRKRAEPGDDLLSALIAARDGSDRLSEDELTSMVFLLLVAGHETTVNLIGNGVHALLTHPEQLALVRADPDRIADLVEEVLRYECPVQAATFRVAAEPVELGGVTIGAGELVVASVLAANRDPGRFADAEVMDLARAENSHVAFGYGIHHCLGAPLARLEGRIALGALLARFPRLRLAVAPEELSWRPSVLMHGLTQLPVLL